MSNMSVDYQLYIPPYVPIDFIKKFIGAVYGDQKLKKRRGSSCDTDNPSSPENPWSIDYNPQIATNEMFPGLYCVTHAVLQHNAQVLANRYNLHIDHCPLESKYMGYKLMSNTSGPLQLVDAHKLVHAVGGKLIYINVGKKNTPHCITVEKGSLNKNFFHGLEERTYYQCQNFIANTPHLTLHDILEMQKFAYYDLNSTLITEVMQLMENIRATKEKEVLSKTLCAPISRNTLKI